MRRLMSFLIGPVFFVAVVLISISIFLTFVINDKNTPQPGVVHLKQNVADSKDREGEVTKSDKYVIVKTPTYGREVFSWNEIQYISEKDLSTSRRLDQIVELIDMLSKFGLVATLLFFTVGLYQYRQTQKWEREKFLAAAVKEFDEAKNVRNARLMLDSLALYDEGRMIELLPQEEKVQNQNVFVDNYEIYWALTPNPHTDIDKNDLRAVAIRDCFDAFFSYLGTFDHYIQQRLITKDALAAHVGYWIDLLGPEGQLDPIFKKRVLGYAAAYKINGVADLIKKYNPATRWERIRGWFK
jgi:hypothetical protein